MNRVNVVVGPVAPRAGEQIVPEPAKRIGRIAIRAYVSDSFHCEGYHVLRQRPLDILLEAETIDSESSKELFDSRIHTDAGLSQLWSGR